MTLTDTDDPFAVENSVIVAVSPPLLPIVVRTPTGDEIVLTEVFDEPTHIYGPGELQALLALAHPNRHPTVRISTTRAA